MLIKSISEKRKESYISSTSLIIIALASAFFPRVLMLIKFPSMVNFLHFAVVPFVFGIAISKSRSQDRQQLAASKQILFTLLLLLTIGLASAFLNDVGLINVILQFLLFNEPWMLLLAIICIPMSTRSLNQCRNYVLGFGFINLIFALLQKFILRWDRGLDPCGGLDGVDTITGVFVCQGAGCIVGASVSMALSAHYFVAAKHRPLWLRELIIFACLVQIIVADAKQVLIVGGIALALLSLANMKDVRKGIISVVLVVTVAQIFWWAIFNFQFLSNFAGWIRPEIYSPDGEATRFKLFGVNAILDNMHSLLHWLFGLGPGHTVDRLGGWMLRDYSSLLAPLGATTNTIAAQVWSQMSASWLANGSTMFSPFFGWAAVWGDLGIVGIVTYCYLYFLIWRYLCKDDVSKFQLLCVFVVGWVQAGLQEPGFMLFVASLIGLHWQEVRKQLDEKII